MGYIHLPTQYTARSFNNESACFLYKVHSHRIFSLLYVSLVDRLRVNTVVMETSSTAVASADSPSCPTTRKYFYSSASPGVYRISLCVSALAAISIVAYWCSDYIPSPPSTNVSGRFLYTVRCVLPMFITFLFALGGVGMSNTPTESLLTRYVRLEMSIVAATLEQMMAAVLLMFIGTAYFYTAGMLKIIPVYSMVFITGRVLSRIGHNLSPLCRKVGYEINVVSTLAFLCIIFYLIFHNLVATKFA